MSNEEFASSVEAATLQIIQRAYNNVQAACFVVEGDARRNVHSDLGELAASMFSQVTIEGDTIVGRVANSCEYAPYVHQGTGLYAVNGDGRKTPWGYTAYAGKYKGYHWTHGQHPNAFLDKAKISNISKISKLISGD